MLLDRPACRGGHPRAGDGTQPNHVGGAVDSVLRFAPAMAAAGGGRKGQSSVRARATEPSQAEGSVMSDNPCALPRGRFGAIYADPPWSFATWSKTRQTRAAESHYD